MHMKQWVLGLAALVLVLGGVHQVEAGLIVGPVSASTTMGEDSPLVHAFDQSGLSAHYVSGVTDFATFTASTTHDSEPGNDWISTSTSGSVTFDLGSLMTIDKVAVWNFGGLGGVPSFGITQFTLLASVDAGFSSPTTLGTFNPSVFTTLNPAQVFDFAPTGAEFFRLQNFSSNGASSLGLGEIAFEASASAVPEPSSLALMGMATAGFAGHFRWRRRKQAAA
jgi:hypothetical protein